LKSQSAFLEKLNSPLMENTKTGNLLVVSRDPAVLRMLGPLESSSGWRLDTASNGWEAMERMQSGAVSHALVLDIPLEDSEPMHFLRWLRCFRPDFPVVLLCAPEDAGRVRDAAGLGGEDTVYKPFDPKYLEAVMRKRMDRSGMDRSGNGPTDFTIAGTAAAEMASKHIEQLGHDTCFVSASLMMQKLCTQAGLLAKSDVPVLIVGESGAGKYTVASLIHKLSVRSGFKLLRVNCAAMPEAELAAELFGDEGGSASAQAQKSLGKFAAGEKGTIFLEEIAEMPAGVQARLLQVLQNVLPSDVRSDELRTPVGAEGMPVRVRILASSSANLERALAEKRLREDLYHRLSAFTLQVPALRQRKDEMATLLRYFMHNLSRHYGLPAREFSPGVIAACQRYAWPGNLKELEAFVKRYLVTGEPESIGSENGMDAVGRVDADKNAASQGLKTGAAGLERSAEKTAKSTPESLKSLIQGVKWEAERNAIAAALLRTGWNRKAAARMLKVSYRTMLYKIEQYKMRAPQQYLSPVPAGEFTGYESGYESAYGEGKSNGNGNSNREARYAKVR
jgi:two-component system response regulator AtoC